MAKIMQVSEVREAIYQAAGGARGQGAAATPLLGRLFHQVFAELVGADSAVNFYAALVDAEPGLESWQAALIEHAYARLVGPRLRRHQAELQQASAQTINFWRAVEEMCGWLADKLWSLHEYNYSPESLRQMLRAECELSLTLSEPDWSDEVRLIGRADAVWATATNRWCLIELKTGQTAPEADLAQACLYHLMLADAGLDKWGTLALVSFTPQRCERLFSAPELGEAQSRLVRLIGRGAGVLPEQRPATTARPDNSHTPEAEGDSLPAPSITRVEPQPVHLEIGQQLVAALAEYDAAAKLTASPIVGPTFLRFFLTPETSVKPEKILRQEKALQLRLELDAPPRLGIEGGCLVVDIQRRDRELILFSSVRGQLPPLDPLVGSAAAPVGVGIDGRLHLADFSDDSITHLLVAGTTGSGKSEWLRSATAGLMLTNTPATLQLLLIDPKRNAFQMLANSPFLHAPIVYPNEQSVAEVLASLVEEMERRYKLMSETRSDTLADHVRRTGQPMPRLFCVCDEYADVISVDNKQRRAIELQIMRLGAKARAAGIHLILAVQHPSSEIVRGALNANIPARIGLKVQKALYSQMLLNEPGAESLLGKGDLLFKRGGEVLRLQSPYLPPEEMTEVFGRAALGEAA